MLPNWLYGKSKSKLAFILGGGGTPADYEQVKAQVTQNAEEIELLSNGKAAKTDLASISITGDANDTGSIITKGTYFYKDGALVKALLDIADEAPLTQNTNYEIVTAGALNAICESINELDIINRSILTVDTTDSTFEKDGYFIFNNFYCSSHSGSMPYFDFYIDGINICTVNVFADNVRVAPLSVPVKKGMKYKYTISSTGTVAGHSGLLIPYK